MDAEDSSGRGRSRGAGGAPASGHRVRSPFMMPDASLNDSLLQAEGRALARTARSGLPTPTIANLRVRRQAAGRALPNRQSGNHLIHEARPGTCCALCGSDQGALVLASGTGAKADIASVPVHVLCAWTHGWVVRSGPLFPTPTMCPDLPKPWSEARPDLIGKVCSFWRIVGQPRLPRSPPGSHDEDVVFSGGGTGFSLQVMAPASSTISQRLASDQARIRMAYFHRAKEIWMLYAARNTIGAKPSSASAHGAGSGASVSCAATRSVAPSILQLPVPSGNRPHVQKRPSRPSTPATSRSAASERQVSATEPQANPYVSAAQANGTARGPISLGRASPN